MGYTQHQAQIEMRISSCTIALTLPGLTILTSGQRTNMSHIISVVVTRMTGSNGTGAPIIPEFDQSTHGEGSFLIGDGPYKGTVLAGIIHEDADTSIIDVWEGGVVVERYEMVQALDATILGLPLLAPRCNRRVFIGLSLLSLGTLAFGAAKPKTKDLDNKQYTKAQSYIKTHGNSKAKATANKKVWDTVDAGRQGIAEAHGLKYIESLTFHEMSYRKA